MTQQSFDNYKDQVSYLYLQLNEKLSIIYSNGSLVYHKMQVELSLLSLYIDLLNYYELVADPEDDTTNFLTAEEMIELSEFAHRILGLTYYIDFVLGDDLYGSIPTFSWPVTNLADVAETKNTYL